MVTPKPVPEPDKYPNVVEEKPLPGKKAYIPPYTPKSALRNSSSSLQRSRGLPSSLSITQKNGGGMGNRNFHSSQRSGSNSRSSSAASNHNPMNQFCKNKRSKDSDDDECFPSNAVLPKRESSKRAAKEKSSAKRVLQEKVSMQYTLQLTRKNEPNMVLEYILIENMPTLNNSNLHSPSFRF